MTKPKSSRPRPLKTGAKLASRGPTYRKTPGDWHAELTRELRIVADDEHAYQLVYDRRERAKQALIDHAKRIRQYADGFDAKHGYDLTKVAFWPKDRVEKVLKFGVRLRMEETQGFNRFRPRSAGSKAAIARHTGNEDFPQRKLFNIIAPQPDGHRIKIVKSVKTIKGKNKTIKGKKKVEYHVEELRRTPRGEQFERNFYLPRGLTTFEEIRDATKEILPRMPNGYYILISSVYGGIAEGMPKYDILRLLPERFFQYDEKRGSEGFAGTILGYKLVGYTREDDARQYRERVTWREQLRRHHARIDAQKKRERLKRHGKY